MDFTFSSPFAKQVIIAQMQNKVIVSNNNQFYVTTHLLIMNSSLVGVREQGILDLVRHQGLI